MTAVTLSVADWWGLFFHFLVLSLLAIGGAIATVPDMHRYLVLDKHWLSDEVFASSVALAQAAPGPNLLFVPVLGFQVAGVTGALVTLVGMLLPSTTLALTATRWMAQRRAAVGVKAFVAGMMPVTLGLLLATGWVLASALRGGGVVESPLRGGGLAESPLRGDVALVVLVAATAVTTWRTKIAPVWLVAGGAVLGAMGLI